VVLYHQEEKMNKAVQRAKELRDQLAKSAVVR
jgi:hypothetical protein